MFADLHIHTYYSDGTFSPHEVISKAKEIGLGAVSICDHNTVDAYGELRQACSKFGVKLINGVEIDCVFNNKGLHILALGVDIHNAGLLNLLNYNIDVMEQMSIDLIEKMSVDNQILSPIEYENFQRNPKNGGWKGIDYLRSKGFPADYPECMKYYTDYKVSLSKPFYELTKVCDIIHQAGGFAVLAHPDHRIDNDPQIFIDMLQDIYKAGIDGVECYYPSHSTQIANTCVQFCKEKELLITAGSDCHGEFAKVVDGIIYELGAVMVDEDNLDIDRLIKL